MLGSRTMKVRVFEVYCVYLRPSVPFKEMYDPLFSRVTACDLFA
jgi:hypothetical protein